MNFAKKLRDVVASNFIEIARTDEQQPVADTYAPLANETLGAVAYREPRDSRPDLALQTEPDEADQTAPELELTPAIVAAPEVEVAAIEEEVIEEAVPVVEEAVVPPTVPEPVGDLTRFLTESGGVDMEVLLRSAGLPAVPFPAEKAGQMIMALPSDLPMKMKQMTVKATLEALDQRINAKEIVADAILKKIHISQFRDALNEQVLSTQKETEREVARLQAEVLRLKELLQATEQKRANAEVTCRTKLEMIEQVIFFFQSEEKAEAAPSAESEEELPPFMRDDAVKRMLGINPSDEDALPNIETASERRARSRRRIPVSDTVESGEVA